MISKECATKHRWPGCLPLYSCFLFSFLSFPVFSQTFSIDWSKVSGGGSTSAGGSFQVIGTVGQSDAGLAMSGGNYSITGGFWSLYALSPAAPLLTVSYAPNLAIVSWPSTVTGWTLQTNSNLALSAWGNYLGVIVNNRVTSSPPTGTLFFRLEH